MGIPADSSCIHRRLLSIVRPLCRDAVGQSFIVRSWPFLAGANRPRRGVARLRVPMRLVATLIVFTGAKHRELTVSRLWPLF